MTLEEQIALAKSIMGKLVRTPYNQAAATNLRVSSFDTRTYIGIPFWWRAIDRGTTSERVLIKMTTLDHGEVQISVRVRTFEIAEE